jgi:pyridoxal phosphate enzyme (YggS family)
MSIAENLLLIEERIQKACRRAGRNRDEIRLMGVSKFHGPGAVEEAWRGGLRLFGESRVQEAVEKFTGFRERYGGVEIHMIGVLQRNKAKTAAALFDCIQSVDRDSLIRDLGKICVNRERPLEILLELHTGEESKSGFPGEESLFRAAEAVLSCPGLRIRGLMTMAPFTRDGGLIRSSFQRLVKARDALAARFPGGRENNCAWDCLSMGMSNDFEIAVEEGSTLLRIGTGIFGERR